MMSSCPFVPSAVLVRDLVSAETGEGGILNEPLSLKLRIRIKF